jgi:hypothetical protein
VDSGPLSIHRLELYWAGRESSFVRWHGRIGGDRSGRIVNNTTRQRQRKESEANPDSSWCLQPLDRELREHAGPGVTVLPFSLELTYKSCVHSIAVFLVNILYSIGIHEY